MSKWKFGIIGCGSVADFHFEAIREIDDAALSYVSSRNEAKVKAVAEREGCAWTTDYRELIGSPDVDIVCVTTSSGSHAAIGMEVIAAGKHLVVEKPLAMNVKEAAGLIAAAYNRGVTLSVISQRRFEVQHQAVKRVLDDGAIGRLLLVEVSLPFYRTQDYYDTADWRGTIAEDGGALMNQGIHSIDLMLWMGGEVRTVFGKTATQTHHIEAEDLGLAIVQFHNGAYGTIMASTSIQPGFPACINLYGEKGTIKLEGNSIVHWSVPGVAEPKWNQQARYGGVNDPRSIAADFHQSQFLDIISSIETGAKPLVSGEEGMRAVQLVESIYESAAKNTQLTLPRLVDALKVNVYDNRQEMGAAAGADVASAIKRLLQEKESIRMIFAAAPSQNELLASLRSDKEIDWSRITAFHMDEYNGLPQDAPQRFSNFLRSGLFDQVKPGTVHLIDSSNDSDAECKRYSELLNEAPIDIVCLGIGENGHLAFNDPPVADFRDPQAVKVVELDEACRQQQVNDGCFSAFVDVPTHAITLTIPTLLGASQLFCVVPGPTKRQAVQRTLNGPVSTECPSTILRQHSNCTLYVDRDSYGG
ncbi:Gfo/Idh/MocA family protein [Paenibacillus chungangensis]|uniref:Gfo/Idh/MocA family oxidoreductase n=1 Tax=Paenibacillus chungangensis TaxID=696535 RepID=A0ABW3HW93_9BACL